MSNGMQALEPLAGFGRSSQRVDFRFGKAILAVSVLTESLLRVRYAFEGQFLARRSWAVAPEDSTFSPVDFEIKEDAERVTLSTSKVSLQVRRKDGGVAFLDAAGNTLLEDAAEMGPTYTPGGAVASLKKNARRRTLLWLW